MITTDISFNFAARWPIRTHDLVPQISVSLVDMFLPIVVMFYYLQTIRFAEYMVSLLKSQGLINYLDLCSIFLKPTGALNESKEKQDEDHESKDNGASDTTENDIWIDSIVHSSNTSQVIVSDQSESLLMNSVQK